MNKQIIELDEYIPLQLHQELLPLHVGKLLKSRYGDKIAVEFPSAGTDYQWKLISRGWVGFIPLTSQIMLRLAPKVEISNLFQMLEYAYDLNINFQDNLVDCATIEGFYERLAQLLASKVLRKAQKGFYQTYVSAAERLPRIRGRIDIKQAIYNPWEVNLKCCYQELTGDVPENQILAWSLFLVVNSGLCSHSLPLIRQSYQALRGIATICPYSSYDCTNRNYNRLNEDYRPLHALCRFFIESTGASHHLGDYTMLAFLVNMAQLFEVFVAEWLAQNLPAGYALKKQERMSIETEGNRCLKIDLVIYNTRSSLVYCVLDTKYKRKIDDSDLYQITAYAVAKEVNKAVLIYPQAFGRNAVYEVGDIRVQAIAFTLHGDLQRNGEEFISTLFKS
jgi:5-methylcytosine-specific restriction enzyme subunit McrC